MNLEVERKYKISDGILLSDLTLTTPKRIEQGYIKLDNGNLLRIRKEVVGKFQKFSITVKEPSNSEDARVEYEESLESDLGKLLLNSCSKLIIKDRYNLSMEDDRHITLDVFISPKIDPIIEVESNTYNFDNLPDYIGENITSNSESKNSNIYKKLFTIETLEDL